MKTELIHMSDDYDVLKAGHDYYMRTLARAQQRKCVRFTDTQTGDTVSLWPWQVEHAMTRGKMHKVTEPVSDAMSAPIVSKLCHSTDTRYIY